MSLPDAGDAAENKAAKAPALMESIFEMHSFQNPLAEVFWSSLTFSLTF